MGISSWSQYKRAYYIFGRSFPDPLLGIINMMLRMLILPLISALNLRGPRDIEVGVSIGESLAKSLQEVHL